MQTIRISSMFESLGTLFCMIRMSPLKQLKRLCALIRPGYYPLPKGSVYMRCYQTAYAAVQGFGLSKPYQMKRLALPAIPHHLPSGCARPAKGYFCPVLWAFALRFLEKRTFHLPYVFLATRSSVLCTVGTTAYCMKIANRTV